MSDLISAYGETAIGWSNSYIPPPSVTPLYSPHLSVFSTGLSTSQPDHPGPGDPDRALPARDSPAPGGAGLPVFPQRLGTALFPLQGPSGPIRDPDRECLFPPEGLHRKHIEVWIRPRFLNLKSACSCSGQDDLQKPLQQII